MRRLTHTLAALCLAALCLAGPARADEEAFGAKDLDLTFIAPDGSPAMQAGSHPFAVVNRIEFNTRIDPKLGEVGVDAPKDILVKLPTGLVGEPGATPRCSGADFANAPEDRPSCASAAAVGTVNLGLNITGGFRESFELPVYNLEPAPGTVQKFGFNAVGVPVTIEFTVEPTPPYNVVAAVRNVSQAVTFLGSRLRIWGVPADPVHDPYRGNCLRGSDGGSVGICPSGIEPRPLITAPRACRGPLATEFALDSWQEPGVFLQETIFTHDSAEPPNPIGFSGCPRLAFNPSISAQPTSKAASSPTGLDFSLDVNDEGLTNPTGIANSDIEKVVVTLPEGMSANPSIAEGLNVCTMADLNRESPTSEAGEGCPSASKIGSVEVETPLLEQTVKGALYIAKPYENYAENSLLAMYLVLQNRELGISVRQPLKVEPDPVTGQLTTVAEELPQLPFSHFKLHFREGARSPLTTPQACGSYDATATLYPYAGGPPVTSTSAFQVISGPNGAPCPTGGLPPFKPGLVAGTLNNRAGSFSPFYLRLFRNDSEQEITHFSIKLPPGITGKLAGIPYCSDAAIELAKSRTGPHGGQEELDSPSCPQASEIGHTLAGAGVGPSLTYAPGKVYLAGPYNGSNLSMVAITAGVVGPFDIGTVVVREGFKINPETAEVFIDSTGSDPIPHIIRGIPVHLRDIRAYVDRPEFVLNPTDCSPTSTASTVLGSGLDFVSEADDNPVTVASRFQAADCAALTFAPRLSFKLIGGTKRGKFPKLVSHLQMNGIGESGIASAQVILPHSEFIENAHFVNICTRVQFKEGAGNGSNCPAGSIYGHARAVTPILAEPLEGPVMLRSNPERKLPDVVAALHNSQVDFDLVGNVDSVKGQLRTTFAGAPDAPVTSFDLELEGGQKGLFVNSTDLCLKKQRVKVAFAGQNGKQFTTRPVMAVKCKGKARKHKRHNRRHHRRGRS
jgi:hypothetical protein